MRWNFCIPLCVFCTQNSVNRIRKYVWSLLFEAPTSLRRLHKTQFKKRYSIFIEFPSAPNPLLVLIIPCRLLADLEKFKLISTNFLPDPLYFGYSPSITNWSREVSIVLDKLSSSSSLRSDHLLSIINWTRQIWTHLHKLSSR